MVMSNEEALGGAKKQKPAMGHSQQGSTSHPEEALGGMKKKKVAPAHVGFASTSHEEETLCQDPKKRIPADTSHNKSLGSAAGAA